MIDIIIPTFQPGEYISECLKSLENQTLQKEMFRVFIILNGDKEPYFSNINKLLEELKINSYLIYTVKKGVSHARNLGLDKVLSRNFVAFIDDDDFISPKYLESLLNSMQDVHTDSIVCSDVRTLDDKNTIGLDYISRAYKKGISHPHKNSVFERRKFLSSSCCKLIPAEIIGKRRFDTDIKRGEDSLFMASISDKIKHINLSDSDAIYYRRLRIGSASRSKELVSKRVLRKSKLTIKYITQYCKHFRRYNLWFFLSRIAAVIIG